MKIINEDIKYEIRDNKIVMDREVYTELLYRIHKSESEHLEKVYFLQQRIIKLNDVIIKLKDNIMKNRRYDIDGKEI